MGLQLWPKMNCNTLRKLYFHFFSNRMGYDRGDSFPFDFLNQIEFHLVHNRKEYYHHDHIPFNLKGNGVRVFSVQASVFEHRKEDNTCSLLFFFSAFLGTGGQFTSDLTK